ncbi:TraK family protein [Thiolapillus sp.]
MAVKKDVTEAIEAGYSLKTIWEYLKEGKKIRFTYD